jgi:hypothetical protein
MHKQAAFFELCRQKASDQNLAQSVSELLNINLDAAYRRIRGTTPLTFDEIAFLCDHFKVSFDAVIGYDLKMVPFQFNAMFKDKFQILDYLQTICQALEKMSSFPETKMSLTAMDIPYFRLFGHKSLSRFKLFFWQRSVLNLESYRHKKFDASEIIEDYEEIVEKIYYYYHGIHSFEIWSPETLDSVIKQIQYYNDSGLFLSQEDMIKVCEDLEALLLKLEREAETGQKKILNHLGNLHSKFEMYQSDIFISNNCIQADIGEDTYTYITFNTFNHLMSFQPEFSTECGLWVEQMRSKSVLLSEVSEKLRYQYFLNMRKKLNDLRMH